MSASQRGIGKACEAVLGYTVAQMQDLIKEAITEPEPPIAAEDRAADRDSSSNTQYMAHAGIVRRELRSVNAERELGC